MLFRLPRRGGISPVSFFFGVLTTIIFGGTLQHLFPGLLSLRPRSFGSTQKKLAVFFGDSLTQHGFNVEMDGWLAALANKWSRKVDCINRGFSGYNSRWGLAILDEVVLSLKPDLVTLFWGANDAVFVGAPTHVSLEEYQQNLETMVTMTRKRLPATTIVLITPPPIWEAALEKANVAKGKSMALDRKNDRTLLYSNAVVAVGSKLNVPVINAWKGMNGDTPARELYLLDGLHFNTKGNQQLFLLYQELIKNHLPKWNQDQLPLHKEGWEAMVMR